MIPVQLTLWLSMDDPPNQLPLFNRAPLTTMLLFLPRTCLHCDNITFQHPGPYCIPCENQLLEYIDHRRRIARGVGSMTLPDVS